MKILHRDPTLHAQRVAAIKKAKRTAAARKRASEAMKAFFFNPENRRKRSIAMKGIKYYCRNCGREGHRKYYCPESSPSDRQFKCRLCGEKGHNRRTCKNSKSNSTKGKTSRHHCCKICGQSGHNSRTCPQEAVNKKKGIIISDARLYSCGFCREKGHNIRACPTRKKM